MLQSVFGTLKLHDFDSSDYLEQNNNTNGNSNNKNNCTSSDQTDFVKSDKSLTHGERYKNALLLTNTLDNGAYLRLAPFNVNYLQEMEKDTEEMHIHENYTNR